MDVCFHLSGCYCRIVCRNVKLIIKGVKLFQLAKQLINYDMHKLFGIYTNIQDLYGAIHECDREAKMCHCFIANFYGRFNSLT